MAEAMKEGLFFENDELIYYKNGAPYAAGAIQVEGAIYYISSSGKAVRGKYMVHWEKANGLLEAGYYTFDENYKLVPDSFRPARAGRGFFFQFLLDKLKSPAGIALVCGICLLAVLMWGAHRADGETESPAVGQESQTVHPQGIVLPDFNEEVLLSSLPAKRLYDGENTAAEAVTGGNPYQPLIFNYALNGKTGTLQLSEDPAFADFREYELAPDSAYIQIDNLKTGTDYYYRVLVGEEVFEGGFKTAASTRFVSIPGLKNTRDIGGYTTLDGRTVRQGLLIRGMEFDGLVESSYFIPKDEIEGVQETFGFVCDLDLREASIYKGYGYQSRFGKDVLHGFYQSPQYGGIFREEGMARIRDIFRALAKPEHYPMYLHCTYGIDRTGTVIFLLQGLLGMSEEDMIREYQRSGFFSRGFAESHNMEILIDGMQGYHGDTLQEKIENYFVDFVGITPEEIETIRSIFLE